ncbi:hypothetical protein Syun_001778 [Stephania yunnanensis]|uniref:Uncharacterized protein n=1 Tax=Stephania yunnanensis TaxID=152371 RepID=A0AAP0LFG9_9MAGN
MSSRGKAPWLEEEHIGCVCGCGGCNLGVHQLSVCKTTSSGDDTRALSGERSGRRAQTTSYRKSKELEGKAKDVDEESRAQTSDVLGR